MKISITPPPREVIRAASVTLVLSPRELVLLRGILGNSEPEICMDAFNSSTVSSALYPCLPDDLKAAMTNDEFLAFAKAITDAFDSVYKPA